MAALICVATCIAAMTVFERSRSDRGTSLVRMAFAGAFFGVGVWATHFVAMLAYQPSLPTGYEPFRTALSLAIAVAVPTGAFLLARRAFDAIQLAAGAVLGLGIAAMHFTGISAFETAGRLSWQVPEVVVALGLAVGLGAAALFVSNRFSGWRAIAIGAGLMVLAICGLHFTAMDAITITPDSSVAVESTIDRPLIGLAIALVIGLLMTAALVGHRIEILHSERASRRLRAAIDAMPEGMAFFDRDDRMQVWNERYAQVLALVNVVPREGMPLGEMAQAVAAMLGQSLTLDQATVLARAFRADPNRPQSAEVELGDGAGWLRIQEKATPDGGYISTLVDITELKRQAQSLTEALDQAQAANRAKTAFLANMSHEIRTPLNGVLGAAQVLAGSSLSQRQGDLVGVIKQSAALLDEVLKDVLDLARADAGAVRIVAEPLRLGDLLRAAGMLHRPSAEAKGLALTIEDALVADDVVLGDAGHLRRILGGFLSNAVKFTERGQVRLEAERLADGRYRFTVADSGPGVDPERAGTLFERFSQSDNSITRPFGGSGLGLAICREYAAMMGGEASYAPGPDGGARFSLTIALAPAEATQPMTPWAEPTEEAALRALVVDDNETNRKVLGLILGQLGADHVEATNGADAVDAYRREPFDVVLMDLQMPVMDGLTATSTIRAIEAQEQRRRTPVIIVSANCQPEHHAAGVAAGADAHLPKPVSVPDLINALTAAADASADLAAA